MGSIRERILDLRHRSIYPGEPGAITGRRDAPAGATHVLAHYPAQLAECGDPHPDGDWEVQTLRDYRKGNIRHSAGFAGPGSLSPGDLAIWLRDEALGYPVRLTRFDEELRNGHGGRWVEPAYYVTPGGR